MKIIANISCYFYHSVATPKLHKEYLITVIYNTPVLLWIKTEQFDIQNTILCQHIRELQTFEEQSSFWAHTVYTLYLKKSSHLSTFSNFVKS